MISTRQIFKITFTHMSGYGLQAGSEQCFITSYLFSPYSITSRVEGERAKDAMKKKKKKIYILYVLTVQSVNMRLYSLCVSESELYI